eukprot:1176812-Prorocentrum_minimum.AAC.1
MGAREAEKEKKTLGEIPSTAAATLGELGVRGPELDKLLDVLHMIAVGKADECIQEEILRHEISGLAEKRLSSGYKRNINMEGPGAI